MKKGFIKPWKNKKKRARNAAKFQYNLEEENWINIKTDIPTEFVGYHQYSSDCNIIKYSIDVKNAQIVLDKTPFYAESGGQVADLGRIYNDECEMRVIDVQKKNDQFIHIVIIEAGVINDKTFTAVIEKEFRQNIARNHTATHLLHKALREVLGEHVQQKGSLVHTDYLRFDFTHFQAVTPRELRMVEEIVNKEIRACLPISTEIKNIEQAKKDGAVALFGEKYGENVRVVSIQDFSMELCGGTHVSFTGEIGFFKFTSESSIAAGIRRVEAVTAKKAEKLIQKQEDDIEKILMTLNSNRVALFDKLEKMISEHKEFLQKIKQLTLQNLNHRLDELVQNAELINGIPVITAKIDVPDGKIMRLIGDNLKQKLQSGISVLISEVDQKISILAIVTDDLKKNYHAGKIVGQVAKVVGGKGGGRPDMAMAGGKETSKINEALKKAREIITNQ